MSRRPLVVAAACYAAGTATGCLSAVPPVLWAALMTLSGVWVLFSRRLCAVFCALMLLGAWAAGVMNQPGKTPEGTELLLDGRVCEAADVRADRTVITLDRARVNGVAVQGKVRVYLYEPLPFSVGEQLRMSADLWRAQGQRNAGGFDFAAYLRRQGVVVCATADGDTLERAPGGFTMGLALARLRESILTRLDALFLARGALARSLLMGDKSDLPEETMRQFRDAGAAHLLAVSGLHISCIAAAVAWLLVRLSCPRSVAFALVSAFVWGYACLVGLPASAVRAAVMFTMVGGARLVGRPYDPLTGLAGALLLLLWINPLSIADPGLLLSFSAVLGILLLTPLFQGACRVRVKAIGRVLSILAVSVSAVMGTLPALCCLYGAITPYAPLTSLVAVPLCGLLLPVLMGALGLSCIFPGMQGVIAWLPARMLDLLSRFTEWMSQWPGAVIYAPAWSGALCAAYLVWMFACSGYVRIEEKRRLHLAAGLPILCACSFLLAWLRLPQGLTLNFLDAGQGDAILIQAQKCAYFVDVGKAGGPAEASVRRTGQPVSGVFLTHPHDDHAGGLHELLAVRDVPILYLPAVWNACDADAGVAEAVAEAVDRGTRVIFLKKGDVVRLSEDVRCEVLAPAEDSAAEDANAASLVLRVVYGEGSALLTGDLPERAEMRDWPDCDLVKVAHHGANDATSAFLIGATTPSVAVISVGRNGYGHPSNALIERLERAGARVYRTDHSGEVIARIERDGRIEMETFL